MPFHSPAFLLLCLATLGLYYLGPAALWRQWQHGLLLLSSLVFYAFAGAADTLLLLGAVSFNHLMAALVARPGAAGKRALVIAVVVDLCLLAFFKYRVMFLSLLPASGPRPELVIPLGVSFYIFQLIAYQVDLSRGLLQREPSFLRVLLYILFFPHHQAGPIMRPARFLPQFYGPKLFDAGRLAAGGLWVLWGLCKKIAADHLGVFADAGFRDPGAVQGAAEAWALALTYALQIYGDFSGYSDIAVGLGLLLGYELDRNFEQPYLATDPSALWRRWHITLSTWLRDYLYIPLGGNRGGAASLYRNLLLTMLLGGLWHGPSLLFALWGLCHGALLVFQRLAPWAFAWRPLGWALTFGGTVAAWVLFRATSWEGARHLLGAMVGTTGPGSARGAALVFGLVLVTLLSQAAEEIVLHGPARRARAIALWLRIPAMLRGILLAGVVVALVCLALDGTTYIYFRF